MKKRAERAPPDDTGDCKPSKALIDELSALEAMLEQRDRFDDMEEEARKGNCERASEDDRRE